MKDFFISYNKADVEWAEWIAHTLKERGFDVVVQVLDFGPGSNFVLSMHDAADYDRTIAVLSPDYLASKFTAPEWAAAFREDPTGAKRKLVPVRVRECKPAGLLGSIVYIDLVGLDRGEIAAERLLKGLGLPTSKPVSLPGVPKYWSVPRRVEMFTGREGDLQNLHERLNSSSPAAVTAAGAGGIGKTTIANEYAHRYQNEYDIVWWMRAEEKAALAEDFSKLAARFGIEPKDAVPGVLELLRERGRWLIIFDNATAREDYEDYLPDGPGHVLITSRNLNWPNSLDLPVFPRPKAIEFLHEHSGKKDPDAADKLCRSLGDLPLALEVAGAYIRESAISIKDYLDDFGTYIADVTASIAARIEPSLKVLESQSPRSVELISICAFYAPDNIPKFLLKAHFEDVRDFNAAISGLRRFALITVTDDSISIHRLIQLAVRERLEEPKQVVETAVRLISGEFNFDANDVKTWESSGRLLPHALDAASHAEERDAALETASHLLNKLGLYLSEHAARPEVAVEVQRRCLALWEKLDVKNDIRVATGCANLGVSLRELGQLDEAEALLRRALQIREAKYGPDNPEITIALGQLAWLLMIRGYLEEAKTLEERSLSIDEKAFGTNHPRIALRLNNLGVTLAQMGDHKGARNLYERALAIHEASYGKGHPKVGETCHNLGSALANLGDPVGARQHLERAYALKNKHFGPDHPTTKLTRKTIDKLPKP